MKSCFPASLLLGFYQFTKPHVHQNALFLYADLDLTLNLNQQLLSFCSHTRPRIALLFCCYMKTVFLINHSSFLSWICLLDEKHLSSFQLPLKLFVGASFLLLKCLLVWNFFLLHRWICPFLGWNVGLHKHPGRKISWHNVFFRSMICDRSAVKISFNLWYYHNANKVIFTWPSTILHIIVSLFKVNSGLKIVRMNSSGAAAFNFPWTRTFRHFWCPVI